MCGRFLLRSAPESWPENLFDSSHFDEKQNLERLFRPRANVCPTQPILAIIQDRTTHERQLTSLHWGLVPAWATDRKIGSKMINARAETIDEKPSYRMPFARQRCLIPADGYYEWTNLPSGKQPILMERPQRELFCFAAIWERNKRLPAEKDGVLDPAQPLMTCSTITTSPNATLAKIHDRMPVIIHPQDYAQWLDPDEQDVESLKSLLIATGDDFFHHKPVDRVSGE